MKLFQLPYISFCYLIHSNGMVDYGILPCNHQFVGISYNYIDKFIDQDLMIHKSLLSTMMEDQLVLFT